METGHGGLLSADLLMGEEYDENEEPAGWMQNGFDDRAWQTAKTDIRIMRGHLLLPQVHPPIRKMLTRTPVRSHTDRNGRYIYDMGQNMTGTVTVRAEGRKGEKLILRFAEILTEDGALYTDNLRAAKQTDIYTFAEDGVCDYTPRFTFHGFRYVEANRKLAFLEGNVLYSAAAQTGFVRTDVKTVNKIFENQLWGHRGNMLDVPTDCPQRDERLGWTGDAQAFSKTACYNMRMDALYRKYLTDIRDAQLPDGEIPNIAPKLYIHLDQLFMPRNFLLTNSGFAGYGDAIVTIPHALYMQYGDTELLRENYDVMRRFGAYLERGGARTANLGDWLCIEPTSKEVIGDAYFAYDFRLLAEMAAALGEKGDAAHYRSMAEKARDTFCEKHLSADNTGDKDTQCVYALALGMELARDRKSAGERLVRAIKRAGNHLSTGFIGTLFLLPALCDIGRSDLAYALLLCDTYPSWGYTVKMGATTIWEHWDGRTENGLQDPGMNSFNHPALGSVGEWMYAYMGGIRPLSPGYEKILIRPYMDERVNAVDVLYKSCRGDIGVTYDVSAGEMELLLPEKTETRVELPGGTWLLSGGAYRFTRQQGTWEKCEQDACAS